MTDFTATAGHAVQGKHNMASDAFDALRAARAAGTTPKGQELSFSDLVDTLNPLQHIPVVAQIYRHLTGDTISPVARVAGGALYGGPVGLVSSLLDAAVAESTGSDLGEHAIAALTGDQTETQVARAETPQPAASGKEPAAAPVKLAAFDGSETTASIAKPEGTPNPVPKALPQLSPDAFNALINSFDDPAAAKAANPQLAAAATAGKTAAPAAAQTQNSQVANDLIGAMQSGLDQLDTLKRANPDLPLPTAFAPPEASGF